jgi:hypothetical protein
MRIVRTLADSLECEDIITHAALRIRSTLAEIGAVYLLGLPPLAVLIMDWKAQEE